MNYLPETYDMSNAQRKISIHDVTLRDGEQTPHVVFKMDERLQIAKALEVSDTQASLESVSALFDKVKNLKDGLNKV